MRRNIKKLEEKIEDAKSKNSKARAYYELGLFHDNNNREEKAIPNYEMALKLGLPSKIEARALAWLASSLYKKVRLKEAKSNILKSQTITKEPNLLHFLEGLRKRINNSMKKQNNF